MSDLTGARCRGLHLAPLFESLHTWDHDEAAKLCGAGTAVECPAFAACQAMAKGLEDGPLDHRPQGTWAGQLYGVGPGPGRGRARPREHGTQRGYDQHRHRKEYPCRACKLAHYEVLRDRFGVAI